MEKTIFKNPSLKAFYDKLLYAISLLGEISRRSREDHATGKFVVACESFVDSKDIASIILSELRYQIEMPDALEQAQVREAVEETIARERALIVETLKNKTDFKEKYQLCLDLCEQGWPVFTTPIDELNNDLLASMDKEWAMDMIKTFFESLIGIANKAQYVNPDDVRVFDESNLISLAEEVEFETAYYELTDLRDNLFNSMGICELDTVSFADQEAVDQITAKCTALISISRLIKVRLGSVFLAFQARQVLTEKLLGLEVSETEKIAGELQRWQNGEYHKLPKTFFSYFRLVGNEVQASFGWTAFNRNEFLDLYKAMISQDQQRIRELVGESSFNNYYIQAGRTDFLAIGCRKFLWSHIHAFVKENLLEPKSGTPC